MKIKILLILMIFPYLIIADSRIKAAGGLTWYSSFNEAKEDAKERNTDILVNFTGSDWCHWCIKLDEEVFSNIKFKEWADKELTLLYLDFPRNIELPEKQILHNQMLAHIYGVQGYPTILFLNSNGELIVRTGYKEGVDEFIKSSKDLMNIYNQYIDAL